MKTTVNLKRGNSPLILGIPHTGTNISNEIWNSLNNQGRLLADTDWHVDRLYDGLRTDVTVVQNLIHRYVIDVNRSPNNESLYPGKNTTELCPTTDFDGNPIYLPGLNPTPDDIAKRIIKYHKPYHKCLADEINRVKAINGFAILYDCHSIRSVIPYLFSGVLPDFNIGTNNGITCSHSIEQKVLTICNRTTKFSTIVNGRFKGGWTTRQYGKPHENIHAIQMELAQSTHLIDEKKVWKYSNEKAIKLRPYLNEILCTLQSFKKEDF